MKVRLAAGERRTLRFELDERAFAHWNLAGWTVTPGAYTVAVGANSRDLPLSHSVTLSTPAPVATLGRDSTTGEWMSHPAGGPAMRDLFATMNGSGAFVTDPETFKLIEAMPLRTLIGFVDADVDSDAAIAGLLERIRP